MFLNQGSLQTPTSMHLREANGAKNHESNIQYNNYSGSHYSPQAPVNLMNRIDSADREKELRELLLSQQRSRRNES